MMPTSDDAVLEDVNIEFDYGEEAESYIEPIKLCDGDKFDSDSLSAIARVLTDARTALAIAVISASVGIGHLIYGNQYIGIPFILASALGLFMAGSIKVVQRSFS